MNSGKILLGVLAGVAAGALIGVLLAPDKGEETRKNIIGKGDDLADGLKSKFSDLVNSILQKFEVTKKEAEKLAGAGKAGYENVKGEVKQAAMDIKHTGS